MALGGSAKLRLHLKKSLVTPALCTTIDSSGFMSEQLQVLREAYNYLFRLMKIMNFLTAGIAAAVLFVPANIFARSAEAVAKPNANLELARQLNEAFVQVAEQVSPAVVVITVVQKPMASSRVLEGSEDEQDQFYEQFRRFFQREQEPVQPQKTTGQGSGIIIRKNGYILTNRHVVEDAENIEVRLKDGRTFKGEVRGVDAPADVAVIKIEADSLPVARLADSSKTRVGEFAIAIGAPFALDYTVTFGHVSAKDRSNIVPLDGERQTAMMDQSFIQTDANINPGNSGGPLVNIDGEVIGINTLIRGLHTGIGFAIPSNLAREIADKLITDGKFTRSWLGIGIRSLREYPEFRDLVPGVQDGVVVEGIVANGPAAKSKPKLAPADVITAVDGKPVVTAQQLKDEIRSKRVGQEVVLDVYRSSHEGGKMKITVKPGEWVEQTEVVNNNNDTSSPEISAAKNPLGLSVKTLTSDLARKFNVDQTDGVIVVDVDKNGIAAQGGIQEGDIITKIDGHTITNARQFREATKNIDTKKGTIVHLISDGSAKFEVLKEATN